MKIDFDALRRQIAARAEPTGSDLEEDPTAYKLRWYDCHVDHETLAAILDDLGRYREALERIVSNYDSNSTTESRIIIHPADIARMALGDDPRQDPLSTEAKQ